MESFFNGVINKFDQITKIQPENYLMFFSKCVDHLNIIYLILSVDIHEFIDDEYYEDFENKEELLYMTNEDLNVLKINKHDFSDIEMTEYIFI